MGKRISILLLGVALSLLLAACGSADDNGSTDDSGEEDAAASATESQDNEQEAAEQSEDKGEEETDQSGEDLSLPDDFPADFPLPDNIVITGVEDESDDEATAYYIDFTFDEIDVDATFDIYRDYAEKIEYSVHKDGELKNMEDVYQIVAYNSTVDRFIVTLKPKGQNGVIQISVGK